MKKRTDHYIHGYVIYSETNGKYVGYLNNHDDRKDHYLRNYQIFNKKENFERCIYGINHTKDHPYIFSSYSECMDMIIKIQEENSRMYHYNLRPKYAIFIMPKCMRECLHCNKKKKWKCKHLMNNYQNICGFGASFKDEFEPEEGRLDAPCEKCLNEDCNYNMFKYSPGIS